MWYSKYNMESIMTLYEWLVIIAIFDGPLLGLFYLIWRNLK